MSRTPPEEDGDVGSTGMGVVIVSTLKVDHPGAVGRLVLAATLPGNGHATVPPTSESAMRTLTGGNIVAIMGQLVAPGARAAEKACVHGNAPDIRRVSGAVVATTCR